jgi:hypothetical protein
MSKTLRGQVTETAEADRVIIVSSRARECTICIPTVFLGQCSINDND